MKSMKRALRRHHRQRMIRRAYRCPVLKYSDWGVQDQRDIAVAWCNNLAKCSCWMCGNPRKYFGRSTLQEQRLLCRAFQEVEDPTILPPSLTRRVCRYCR